MTGMLRRPFQPRHRRPTRPPSASLRGHAQRAAFAILYGPGARAYDRFTRWLFAGEWRHWQDTALPFLPSSGIILEIGLGTGALAARAVSAERRWCGVELSPSMIDAAHRRRAVNTFELVRGDARQLPFAADRFDGAVATFPSAYILDAATHRELNRVVKTNGVLVVVLTGCLEPRGAGRLWRRRLLATFYGRRGGRTTAAEVTFAIPGFVGNLTDVPTPNGRALVYVGTRAVDQVVGRPPP